MTNKKKILMGQQMCISFKQFFRNFGLIWKAYIFYSETFVPSNIDFLFKKGRKNSRPTGTDPRAQKMSMDLWVRWSPILTLWHTEGIDTNINPCI